MRRGLTAVAVAAVVSGPTPAVAVEATARTETPRLTSSGESLKTQPRVRLHDRAKTERTLTIPREGIDIRAGRITLSGTLSPAKAGVTVGVAVIRHHRDWTYLAQTVTQEGGTFTITVPFSNGEQHVIYVSETRREQRAETSVGIWVD